MSRLFVASRATGHICTGGQLCPACNPDNQDAAIAAMVERALTQHFAEAPLAPSRGVLGESLRTNSGSGPGQALDNVIRLHAADDAPLLPPRYITK